MQWDSWITRGVSKVDCSLFLVPSQHPNLKAIIIFTILMTTMLQIMTMVLVVKMLIMIYLDASLLKVPHCLNNLKVNIKVAPILENNNRCLILSLQVVKRGKKMGRVNIEYFFSSWIQYISKREINLKKKLLTDERNLILETILNSSCSNQGETLLHALVNLAHKLCPGKMQKF